MYISLWQGTVESIKPLIDLGVVALLLTIWAKDRVDRSEERRLYNERLNTITMQLIKIVEDNTKALTSLQDRVSGSTVDCPLRIGQ